MRLGQPKEEKRTWPKHLLSLARELSPDYELNRRVNGSRTECLRELVPGGVFVSQNTICSRGRYHHCFGLVLAPLLPVPYLQTHSPFFIGGRFDHNLGFGMSFMRQMGLTPQDRAEHGMSWHDSHEWRPGTDEVLRRSMRTAEQYLLPFYLRRLTAAAGSILELLTFVLDSARMSEKDLRKRAGAVDFRTLDVPADLQFRGLGLFELTDPDHPWQTLSVPERYYALVLAEREMFLSMLEMIPDMRQRLERTVADEVLQRTIAPFGSVLGRGAFHSRSA
jgi:hypothetical protein